ncbi:MAG TPA: hypothetical protein VEK79_15540 [Thermoanaerobaculia bacterium]|nr:hypothetical protein [Thermoanaerobaculia bacterium]
MRSNNQVRIDGVIAVIFGRGEGILIDLSQSGARIRHHAAVRRGMAAVSHSRGTSGDFRRTPRRLRVARDCDQRRPVV